MSRPPGEAGTTAFGEPSTRILRRFQCDARFGPGRWRLEGGRETGYAPGSNAGDWDQARAPPRVPDRGGTAVGASAGRARAYNTVMSTSTSNPTPATNGTPSPGWWTTIVHTPGVCGGRARIDGTRIKVKHVY